MDLGRPISYEVLERGTPVYCSDGERIGNVIHVLAEEREDVFDGIVIAEQSERIVHRRRLDHAEADTACTPTLALTAPAPRPRGSPPPRHRLPPGRAAGM